MRVMVKWGVLVLFLIGTHALDSAINETNNREGMQIEEKII